MKKGLIAIVIVLILIIAVVIVTRNNSKDSNINNSVNNVNNVIENRKTNPNNSIENSINNEIKESEEVLENKIKVTINNKTYNSTLENNETTKQFEDMLPQEFNMSELNGNEKYVYLNNTLPTNSYNPGRIEAGDIMLYGNNCLVVFYKSFNTSYSYTKIGHIENIEDLENKNITIKFEK